MSSYLFRPQAQKKCVNCTALQGNFFFFLLNGSFKIIVYKITKEYRLSIIAYNTKFSEKSLIGINLFGI